MDFHNRIHESRVHAPTPRSMEAPRPSLESPGPASAATPETKKEVLVTFLWKCGQQTLPYKPSAQEHITGILRNCS